MNFENQAQSFTQRQVEIEEAIVQLRKQILRIKKENDRLEIIKRVRYFYTTLCKPFKQVFFKTRGV